MSSEMCDTNDTPILDIRNFSYHNGDQDILKDVSLKVMPGEYVCMVGPNGAGKSTLIKCVNRIWPGGRGDIFLAGQSTARYSQKDLAMKLAYVPQADGRTTPFTVYEFVMMGRYPYQSPFSGHSKKDDEIVRRALEVTGTASFAERSCDQLSGGERQKIFLAAALAQEARVLLLDEPTTFLDPRHQAEIQGALKRINRVDGVAMLCVTHDINGALRNADRIVALREGRVVFDGPPAAFATNEILFQIFDHEFQILEHPESKTPFVIPAEVTAMPVEDQAGA